MVAAQSKPLERPHCHSPKKEKLRLNSIQLSSAWITKDRLSPYASTSRIAILICVNEFLYGHFCCFAAAAAQSMVFYYLRHIWIKIDPAYRRQFHFYTTWKLMIDIYLAAIKKKNKKQNAHFYGNNFKIIFYSRPDCQRQVCLDVSDWITLLNASVRVYDLG